MDLEFACGYISELLHDVAIDLGLNLIKNFNSLIVDLLYLKDS